MHTRDRGYGITMLAAGVVSCLSVHSAIAQPVFEPYVQYATGGWNCTGISLADYDLDGDIDVFASHRNTNNVIVMLNDGTGVFQPGPACPVGSLPRYVRAGDLDGDGRPDFATPNYNGSSVSIGLQNSQGLLVPHQEISVYRPAILEIADMDGDGDRDVVVPHWDQSASQPSAAPGLVTILINDGTGTFSPGASVPIGVQPRGMEIDDFDGDGFSDVIVTNLQSHDLDLLMNAGDGTLLPATVLAGPLAPREVCTGDWNQDGALDYAVVSKNQNEIFFMVNDGDEQFSEYQSLETQSYPHSCAASDLDGDGDLDVVASHVASQRLSVYENIGTGFAEPVEVLSPSGAAEVLIGALDGDDRPDIVTGNTNNATLSVHINDSDWNDDVEIFCRGDIDTDEVVDVLDLLAVISKWGECLDESCLRADINIDGTVDVLDMLLVISLWGDCSA